MKRLLLLLLFTSSLHGAEYAPWFSPLWEIQGDIGVFYTRDKTVQSPKGSFHDPSHDYTLMGSLGITPWPYWNVQVDVCMSRTKEIPFSYEAVYGTVRYQWLDDIRGDPLALVTGVTFSFPAERYLHSYRFAFHGEVNAELHATIGKEWACGDNWWMRGWALGGLGFANRGNGWLHGIAVWEFNPKCFGWGVFTEALYGLGSQDIIPNVPFEGYASIDHRTVDVGGFLNYELDYLGELTCLCWYNAYARNFILHNWGLALNLLIPFSL